MTDYTKALELLFQRPLEPEYTPRDNGKSIFDLPESYYKESELGIKVELESRYGDDVDVKIPLPDFPNKPDLSFADKLGRKQQFSLFNDSHKRIAAQLIQLFLEATDSRNFTALCAFSMNRVNPFLFQYCLSVAVQHRPDTRAVQVPPIAETFPANFVEPSVFQEVVHKTHINIPANYTASDREDEQRLAYFREDIGVNMHHWHWHLAYPTEGLREIVAKDRRGELFYYIHHQILERYNVERFCNNLAKSKPLNNLREPIPEGYFPKILSSVNNRTYPARISNITLHDINHEGNTIEIAECERWRDRIHAAIDQGYVEDATGQRYALNERRGIDLLGDILEASQLSINRQFYGNLHT